MIRLLRHRSALLGTLGILSTVLAAVALVGVNQARESHALEARRLMLRDTAIGMVVGFERQVLHLRGELAMLAIVGPARPTSTARLRRELVASSIDLLQSAPATEELRESAEFIQLLPRLEAVQQATEPLERGDTVTLAEAAAMLAAVDAMLPDIHSYTGAAAVAISTLVNEQFRLLNRQALVIGVLAAIQLLLLAAAGYATWWRQQQQTRARQELEALTGELRRAKTAAEAAADAKGRFLANMSHELRTPFQGVLGMLQVLQRTELQPAQAELVEVANQSANHLLALLNDILDFSAIEAGKIQLEPAPLELCRLCEEVAGVMRLQAGERGLALRVDLAQELPAWVMGDATRIKQILFNLLHNAIKFTPAGEVGLELRARPQGSMVELQFDVVDTGIGMDDATQVRIFQRFAMGDDRLSRRFGGTGLGLEIARNLARLMGGELSVMSSPGAGSRFRATMVLLPAAPAHAGAPEVPVEPQRALRVLLADDQPVNQRYLALALASFGHSARACNNGAEALALVQAERFDAVLMDLHMPVLDGVAATRAIRALQGEFEDLPIVMLTADVMADAHDHAIDAGASAVLTKPVHPEHLAATLASVVTGDRSAAALKEAGAAGGTAGHVLSIFRADPARKAGVPRAKFEELQRRFFASAALQELQAALRRGDVEAVKAAAHAVRGTAGILQLQEVARVALAMEVWAKDGASEAQRARLLEKLVETIASAREAVGLASSS